MLLNVADPSGGSLVRDNRIFSDLPARDQLNIETSRGVSFFVLTYGKADSAASLEPLEPAVIDFFPRRGAEFNRDAKPYRWASWEVPLYQFRLKKSYDLITDYFDTIP